MLPLPPHTYAQRYMYSLLSLSLSLSLAFHYRQNGRLGWGSASPKKLRRIISETGSSMRLTPDCVPRNRSRRHFPHKLSKIKYAAEGPTESIKRWGSNGATKMPGQRRFERLDGTTYGPGFTKSSRWARPPEETCAAVWYRLCLRPSSLLWTIEGVRISR